MRTTEIDCLTNGAPHSSDARRFADFFKSLEGDSQYDFIRCYSAFDLYNRMRKLRERSFEIAEFGALLRDCVSTAEKLVANQALYPDFLTSPERSADAAEGREAAEARTQSIYGNLFRDFRESDYYEHSFEILKERFEINDVTFSGAEDKVALDNGCGSGRFSLALKRLGFREVQGVDFSELNIETATRRRDARNIEGVHYRVANVLELPFEDASFDFVFCNGVLHHTTRPVEEGLAEIQRVLKPGGELFVAVMEKPGGILFDAVELLRLAMAGVPIEFALSAFQLMGLQGFRLYSLMDHLLVPVNVRTAPEDLEKSIEAVGFTSFRRMLRGAASDQVEMLHRLSANDSEALWKYGVGENKYLCVK